MRFYIDGNEVSNAAAAERYAHAAALQGWNERQTLAAFDDVCSTEEGRDMIFTTTGDGCGQVEVLVEPEWTDAVQQSWEENQAEQEHAFEQRWIGGDERRRQSL
jgi:hypothetical protein